MESERDENRVVTIIAVSSIDLETPVTVAVDPVTGAIITESV